MVRYKATTYALALTILGCADRSAEETAQHITRVETALMPRVVIAGRPAEPRTLAARMESLRVPAVSIAVFTDGEIEWARAYGMADVAEERPATPQTLFQAASISKPVAATAALRLVESGALELDEDVNGWLRSWHVPDNQYSEQRPVTLRHLLTHTGGLTVHGFPGYARSAAIPSAVQVLNGEGNTDPVVVDTVPGSVWSYSGGGYTVVQVLLEDVTGRRFPDVMDSLVLGPASMTASTYGQPLPAERHAEAATGYRQDLTEVEEKWHVYPEMAAAGLWTTPGDLARWAMAIQRAYDRGGILSRDIARQMLTPGRGNYGLGVAIRNEAPFFGHDGSNEGFRCLVQASMAGGHGVAVMTNSDNGGALMQEILVTVADEYGWPGFELIEKTVIALDSAALARFAGVYAAPEVGDVTVEATADGLVAWMANGPRFDLLPESETRFFDVDDGGPVRFIVEGDRVAALRVEGLELRRVSDSRN